MSTIQNTDYCFSVKEFSDGTPFIVFEPRGNNLEILKGGHLRFDLPPNTKYDQAKEIASYLNSKNLTVVYDPLT